MPQLSTLEQVVTDAFKIFVQQLIDADDAMQRSYGIPSTFDIRKYGPQDFAFAENRLHKLGEAIPCQICLAEVQQEAQAEIAMQAQQQQGGAPRP
jgi:hypothetical protein